MPDWLGVSFASSMAAHKSVLAGFARQGSALDAVMGQLSAGSSVKGFSAGLAGVGFASSMAVHKSVLAGFGQQITAVDVATLVANTSMLRRLSSLASLRCCRPFGFGPPLADATTGSFPRRTRPADQRCDVR